MPEYTLRVRRYNPETGQPPYWDKYTVDLEGHRSVADVVDGETLQKVRDFKKAKKARAKDETAAK